MVTKLNRAPRLAEQAYHAIKQMIINNELAPGQLLTEGELARTLGISRSPVRAALARLHEERFVKAEPWMGPRVAPLDREYVRELYEVRTVLEGLCARLCTTRLSTEEIEAMAAELKSSESPLRAGDSREFDVLEPKVHRILVERCGNDLLRALVDRLQDHWARIRNALSPVMAGHKLDDFAENHKILLAMQTRNPEKLQSAVETHLSNVASRMLNSLEQGHSS